MTDRERIEALRDSGRLTAREADELLAALSSLPETGVPERTPLMPRGDFADLRARFLRGDIDEATFFRGVRRISWLGSVSAALLVGAIWLVAYPLTLGYGATDPPDGWGRTLVIVLPASLFFGLGVGLTMYYAYWRPQARRLASFRTAVDRSLEPLEHTRCGQCPTCGAEDARIVDWKHPAVMHWILNPGLVVNDLLLGQTAPRVSYDCRQCSGSFVDCESCGRSVDTLTLWDEGGFGNWAGLFCPHCGAEIPRIWNALSWVLSLPFRPLMKRAGARDRTGAPMAGRNGV